MILGYVRVSSADQANDNRSSLQVQQDIIEGFARTRGIDKYGVQIFTDAGVSGAMKLASRPAGADLLAAMTKGDTVIASKLDRMFRSAADALNMFEEFKARGVHLVLFDMGTESVLESAIAKMIVTILAAVADMERVRIKERTAEGRKAKKAKDGPIGCVPFGYRKVGVGHDSTLEVDRREMEALALMRAMYQAGATITSIPLSLADQGYLSRTGKPFHRQSIVNAIVNNAVTEVGG